MIVISNSIKYTLQGGINVKVIYEGKQVVFEVIDTGIGIDKTKNVFEPFNGLKKNNNKETGFGFRLSLCSEIIHLLGGSMEVKSYENKGTEFTFKVPYYNSESEIALKHLPNYIGIEDKTMISIFASKFATTPMASKVFKIPEFQNKEDMKVLLVDDTAANIFVLTCMLKKMGIKYETASNGREAVEKTLCKKKDNYGLIMMDLNMPVLNGIDATIKIKEAVMRNDINDVPIMMLSAQGDEKMKEDAINAGVLEYIEKPISYAKLESSLKRQGFLVK